MLASSKYNTILDKLNNEQTCWDAILEFRLITDYEVIDFALKHLSHPNWMVRWLMVEKCAEIGPPRVIPAISTLLFDSDTQVKKRFIKHS